MIFSVEINTPEGIFAVWGCVDAKNADAAFDWCAEKFTEQNGYTPSRGDAVVRINRTCLGSIEGVEVVPSCGGRLLVVNLDRIDPVKAQELLRLVGRAG